MPAARGEGGEDGEAVGMESEPAPFDVDAAAVEAALGVAVEQTVGPTGAAVLRFRVAVGIDTGLVRHVFVDLGARYFRSTLWAAPHRCLDHLEVTDLAAIGCDAVSGRLVLEGMSLRLVLTRQGTLSIVPLSMQSVRRHDRRASYGPLPALGQGQNLEPVRLDTSPRREI
jgi:hypothetical protein